MLIIITGTVAPGTDVTKLKIKDSKQRLDQYRNALEKIILSRPDAAIVFCDNSNYDMGAFSDIADLALKQSVRFESLSFQGDNEAVAKHGKGYGEGEIVKYVLENSKLATNEDYIIKITGRLIVDNIGDIVVKIKRDRIYFNVPNVHRRDIYDTRMYAMPIDTFKKYFIDGYKKVDDNRGYFLENVYKDIVINEKIASVNFPKYPRIVGVSGTAGISYGYTEWKSRIRDLLSCFNYYGRASV